MDRCALSVGMAATARAPAASRRRRRRRRRWWWWWCTQPGTTLAVAGEHWPSAARPGRCRRAGTRSIAARACSCRPRAKVTVGPTRRGEEGESGGACGGGGGRVAGAGRTRGTPTEEHIWRFSSRNDNGLAVVGGPRVEPSCEILPQAGEAAIWQLAFAIIGFYNLSRLWFLNYLI